MKRISDKDQNQESGDVRHKARMTKQQQQHFEELRKLQESFKQKESSQDKKTEQEQGQKTEDTKKERSEEQKENNEEKSIFKKITEGVFFAVNPQNWQQIISGLKNLFRSKAEEEMLFAEIGKRNRKISAFLASLRGRDLQVELKIAQLLMQMEAEKSHLSLVNLIKISEIQSSLLSDLAKLNDRGAKNVNQLLEKDQSAKKTLEPSTLSGKSEESLAKIKKITEEFTKDGNLSGKLNIGFKPDVIYYLQSQHYAMRDPSSTTSNYKDINLLRPLEYALSVVRDAAQNLIISPIKDLAKGISAEFQNFFSAQNGNNHCTAKNYNCKQSDSLACMPKNREGLIDTSQNKDFRRQNFDSYSVTMLVRQSTFIMDVHVKAVSKCPITNC